MSLDTMPDGGRWTAGRKEDLLVKLRRGELTIEDAFERYGVSEEEIAFWQQQYGRFGLDGLKVKTIQR